VTPMLKYDGIASNGLNRDGKNNRKTGNDKKHVFIFGGSLDYIETAACSFGGGNINLRGFLRRFCSGSEIKIPTNRRRKISTLGFKGRKRASSSASF
jgi:hypothetical protein